MNYSELVAAIEAVTENDDSEMTTYITTAIALAELRICRDVDLDVFRKKATSALTSGDPFLALPTDFVVARKLTLISSNVRTRIIRKDDTFIDEYWPNRTTTGTPLYYAYWDADTMILAPTPGSGFTVELSYTIRPTGLSGSNTTSWLGTNAFDALLYAALMEIWIFKKGEQQAMQAWGAQYQSALQRLTGEQARKRREDYRAGDPLRPTFEPPQVPPQQQ